MSYCLNPSCRNPQNISGTNFCHNCNSNLLLNERYRAIKLIGQGSFGRTFFAIDEFNPSKPRCAIDQFFPQSQGMINADKAAELFQQEAMRLRELGNHPQIPQFLAYFEQDKRLYLMQEFIDGHNLNQELQQRGNFTESKIRQLLTDLLPLLQFFHNGQVIHRDVKPKNIIRRSGDSKLALVNFGVSKSATVIAAIARTGRIIGDLRYIAPEQAVGETIIASDLYSLGVTCIHLLTQKHPFDLYSFSEGDWIWQNYLTNPISNELKLILDKLIVKATKKRYQSASEVIADLQNFRSEDSPAIESELNIAPLSVPDISKS